MKVNGALPQIVEVGPRDGLQNESVIISTADKLKYLELLAASGAQRIEVTSFVHPQRVPQMSDAEQLLASFNPPQGLEISALVLNERGVQRAIAAGVDRINIVVVSTDEFSRRNQGLATDEGILRFLRMAGMAADAGLKVTLTVGAAFGCPFEGEVEPDHIAEIISRCTAAPMDEVCVADTIGVATPKHVRSMITAVREATTLPLRAHFHNTRNTGYSNAMTALDEGVAAIDSSAGGIGGCPFAPAATGNIATEDLLWCLQREGAMLAMDLEVLLRAVEHIGQVLGQQPPGLVGRTPRFPG